MNPRWHSVLGWIIVAAIAGLGCVVLPVFLIPGAIRHPTYGQPLFPWFETAWGNLQFRASLLLFFAVGAALGMAQPRLWLLLGFLTNSLPPILMAISVIHEVIRDPTSNNLWPIGFALCAILGSPALLGALLGSLIRTRKANWGLGVGP